MTSVGIMGRPECLVPGLQLWRKGFTFLLLTSTMVIVWHTFLGQTGLSRQGNAVYSNTARHRVRLSPRTLLDMSQEEIEKLGAPGKVEIYNNFKILSNSNNVPSNVDSDKVEIFNNFKSLSNSDNVPSKRHSDKVEIFNDLKSLSNSDNVPSKRYSDKVEIFNDLKSLSISDNVPNKGDSDKVSKTEHLLYKTKTKTKLSKEHSILKLTHKAKTVFDVDAFASPRLSEIEIKYKKQSYRVGEKLKVTIYLKNRQGQHIGRGGDVLRMWMREEAKSANVNGYVTDNGDGTYSGEILLPWAGNPTVYVTISHTKQAIDAVMAAINTNGILNKMYASFKNNAHTETASCGPLPVFGKDTVGRMCNLTNQNSGYSWYSAAPLSPEVTCEDWKAVSGSNNITVSDYVAEKIRYFQYMRIGKGIQIRVDGIPSVMKTMTIPCSRRPRRDTWLEPVPSGFYYNNKWSFTRCKSSLKRTQETYRKCLRGRHLLIIGDSNTRSHLIMLATMLSMTFRTPPMPTDRGWHFFTYADNTHGNSVSWYPHGSPFFANFFVPKDLLQPVSKHLDEIGPRNNSVILIHLWAHFMRIPFDIFRTHVHGIRVSLEKLLKRSPHVDVVIKGPHAMTYSEWIAPADYIRREHERIWYDEFNGLRDKVFFLNMWDITVGTENVNVHPSSLLFQDQVHIFMSHICHDNTNV